MAVIPNTGAFSFGPQIAKETVATDFYRHKATFVDMAPVDPTLEGAHEIGGSPIPTFPYKDGPLVGGGAVIQPRLESTLGWLLYAAMGDMASAESPGASGMYNHTAKLLAADTSFVPWMTLRKHIPRKDNAPTSDMGEVFEDCKLTGLTLQLPNRGPITARVDWLGRKFTIDDDPTAWTYENTYEDWQSIPVACQTGGFLKVDNVELPIVNAAVSWINQPLNTNAERVFGDPFLEDVTIISRALRFQFTCKWNNGDLYRKALTGSSSGTEWSAAPFTGSFEVKTVSSVNMPTETEPYSLIIGATSCMFSIQGVPLAADNAIMMQFSGTALDNGGTYATQVLRNKTASYTWPT